MPFNPATDPLGIGLASRARNRRQRIGAPSKLLSPGGVHGIEMDALFQAIEEMNPEKSIRIGGLGFRDTPSPSITALRRQAGY